MKLNVNTSNCDGQKDLGSASDNMLPGQPMTCSNVLAEPLSSSSFETFLVAEEITHCRLVLTCSISGMKALQNSTEYKKNYKLKEKGSGFD